MCQVAVVVMETTQLVLSQFKNFLSQSMENWIRSACAKNKALYIRRTRTADTDFVYSADSGNFCCFDCLLTVFDAYKPFNMPPHALSLACSARTTSLQSCSSFIGSRSANKSSSSTPCWFSRRCTVCCRRISRITVSCSPIPGAGLTRLSAIVVSLWLDRLTLHWLC